MDNDQVEEPQEGEGESLWATVDEALEQHMLSWAKLDQGYPGRNLTRTGETASQRPLHTLTKSSKRPRNNIVQDNVENEDDIDQQDDASARKMKKNNHYNLMEDQWWNYPRWWRASYC